ncbi:unnamed protein product [Zymoseptoria tritici ST99CH_3D7]|uniref:BTB domain-containing protein n=1 Tax=Zymoseptoria tritici (strain ST99CH_3D7) TaxID=1276538 RepID=A0A1X7S5T6_ZYMT9|nr:unnamed protein product [Zymoseptoria tritici ST99CH_3D7]
MSLAQPCGEDNEQLIDFAGDSITLIFDSEGKETWTVHRKPLMKSPFFAIALKSTWAEGKTNEVKLLDDDPEVMNHYIHWLYTSTLPRTLFTVLAKLYVLGEKFMHPEFKNAVVLAILRETEEDVYPVGEAVNTIYEGTLKGSLGRQLLVDLFYGYGNPHWLRHHDYHQDFVMDQAMKPLAMNCGADLKEGRIETANYLESLDKVGQEISKEEACSKNVAGACNNTSTDWATDWTEAFARAGYAQVRSCALLASATFD